MAYDRESTSTDTGTDRTLYRAEGHRAGEPVGFSSLNVTNPAMLMPLSLVEHIRSSTVDGFEMSKGLELNSNQQCFG